MAVNQDLARARRASSQRSWLEAHEAFVRADRSVQLEAADLELWATTQLMLAEDDAALTALERAHDSYLERGETVRAVRAAIWIGMNLAYRGAVGPAGGWLGRAAPRSPAMRLRSGSGSAIGTCLPSRSTSRDRCSWRPATCVPVWRCSTRRW
jgi:hypothetical protein